MRAFLISPSNFVSSRSKTPRRCSSLEFFFYGSKLLLPGSKTKIVVAKYAVIVISNILKIWMTFVLSEQLAAAVVLGCVADCFNQMQALRNIACMH